MNIGRLRHRLTLENPGAPIADGDGGYTEVWTALTPPQVWASIETATQRALERLVANTVQAQASHLVTMRFHAGVTIETRATLGPRNADGTLPTGSRAFAVTGLQNVEEQGVSLLLLCQEILA